MKVYRYYSVTFHDRPLDESLVFLPTLSAALQVAKNPELYRRYRMASTGHLLGMVTAAREVVRTEAWSIVRVSFGRAVRLERCGHCGLPTFEPASCTEHDGCQLCPICDMDGPDRARAEFGWYTFEWFDAQEKGAKPS